jgi:16S rRNA (guanine527-N7)-methyltransferase
MDKLQYGAEKLGFRLSAKQLEQFQSYYRELVDWNKQLNLTAITDYEKVQVQHFLDSLTVVQALEQPVAEGDFSVIDVGSGAGMPGVPLKIVLPEIHLVLLEATGKKARFLSHLSHRLGLENVEILTGRAEEVAPDARFRERFELVLSRAVASLPSLVELTLPFCMVGGSFIAQKKGDIEPEIEQSARAIELLGGRLREVKRVELSELDDSRYLVIIDKVAPTPPKYPRRPGMPEKRPLV